MQEMLHPDAFLKGAGLGKVCALVTDGRFSGGTTGSRSGTSPRGRRRRAIGLVEAGDRSHRRAPARSVVDVATSHSPPPAKMDAQRARGSRSTATARSPPPCAPTPRWPPPPTWALSATCPDHRHERNDGGGRTHACGPRCFPWSQRPNSHRQTPAVTPSSNVTNDPRKGRVAHLRGAVGRDPAGAGERECHRRCCGEENLVLEAGSGRTRSTARPALGRA